MSSLGRGALPCAGGWAQGFPHSAGVFVGEPRPHSSGWGGRLRPLERGADSPAPSGAVTPLCWNIGPPHDPSILGERQAPEHSEGESPRRRRQNSRSGHALCLQDAMTEHWMRSPPSTDMSCASGLSFPTSE